MTAALDVELRETFSRDGCAVLPAVAGAAELEELRVEALRVCREEAPHLPGASPLPGRDPSAWRGATDVHRPHVRPDREGGCVR